MKKSLQRCCLCSEFVDLDEEGVQYKTGEAAHEACHDAREFERENAADMRD